MRKITNDNHLVKDFIKNADEKGEVNITPYLSHEKISQNDFMGLLKSLSNKQ